MAFDLTSKGLTLINGPTGSGKSTLCDIPAWILLGITGKGGAVDEIRSWNAEEPTVGTICIDTSKGLLTITRIRGKPKDNDLYFYYDYNDIQRGKDLNDTQKLINNTLGINDDLYLAGSYFHEFSQTAQFFTTTAKNRRLICEQLVDLSLATKLQPLLTEECKTTKKSLEATSQLIRDTEFKLKCTKKLESSEAVRAKNWNISQANKMASLETKAFAFDSEKLKKIEDLSKLYENDLKHLRSSRICSECGAPKEVDPRAESLYKEQLELEKTKKNIYLAQMDALIEEKNPFNVELKDFSKEIKELQLYLEELNKDKERLSVCSNDFELLQEVIADYRSISITNTIQYVETKTNDLLSRHFDSECKVNFTVVDADKLDVLIYKDGNECSFTQLSKGQRCMLKLCFGVSVMQCVENHAGIKFHQLFFDEALDGLDETMKVKAFKLLEELSLGYESVFCVEHSESLKAVFHNSINVSLINGESQIAFT